MHPLLTALRPAVAAGAAAVLLTACSGSGDDDPADTSAAEATTSGADPSPTADPDAAAFCEEATPALAQLTETLDTATEEDIATRLPEVVSTLGAVEAPPAIEADWGALVDALGELADTASSVDLGTPEGQQDYADAQSRLSGQVATSQDDVTNYVISNCSVETAAPSS